MERRTAKVIAKQLETVNDARQRQDYGTFFTAARRALQERLSHEWGLRPETITGEEVKHRLGSTGEVARIFGMADAVEFGGASPLADSLDDWQVRLTAALADFDDPTEMPTAESTHWGQVSEAA